MNDLSAHPHGRRLADKILVAFHMACDQADIEVAVQLLDILESIITLPRKPGSITVRRSCGGLVAAHERLWPLRHPEASEQ